MAYSTHLFHTDPGDWITIDRDQAGDIAVTIRSGSDGHVTQRIELLDSHLREPAEVSL